MADCFLWAVNVNPFIERSIIKLPFLAVRKLMLGFAGLLAILIILLFVFGFFGNAEIYTRVSDVTETRQCESDDDCVPASCCHSQNCINKLQQPDCAGVFCTEIFIVSSAYTPEDCLCQNNACVNKNRFN